jgi:hypothetical protein
MLFKALIELIGKDNLGRPKAVLVGVLGEPDLKTLDRLGFDVGPVTGYM